MAEQKRHMDVPSGAVFGMPPPKPFMHHYMKSADNSIEADEEYRDNGGCRLITPL